MTDTLATLLFCGVSAVCGLVFGLLLVPYLEAEPDRDDLPRRKDPRP